MVAVVDLGVVEVVVDVVDLVVVRLVVVRRVVRVVKALEFSIKYCPLPPIFELVVSVATNPTVRMSPLTTSLSQSRLWITYVVALWYSASLLNN